MAGHQTKPVPSLTVCSQRIILRYLHHVIWRRVDPPNPSFSPCFRPTDLKMSCHLPDIVKNEQKDPKVFRANFLALRQHLSDSLIRPVYEALKKACAEFVFENRLKGGDLLLVLALHDADSRSLTINAKHMVYRRWSLREDRTLHRTLAACPLLAKLVLPGKGDDRVLALLAAHCPALLELDISHSFVTDKGLLALLGVAVEVEVDKEEGRAEEGTEVGEVDPATGHFVRAAAARAKAELDRVRHDPEHIADLVSGRGAASQLRAHMGSLAARMQPYMEARAASCPPSCSWSPRPGQVHRFTGPGCRKLRVLDLNRTNFPKRSIDAAGELMVDLGLTRESVLAAAILLQDLRILRWTELGEILQLLEMVYGEAELPTPELQLKLLCDTRLTLDKLEVTRRLCPKIVKLDISMFNFSLDDQDEATANGQGPSMMSAAMYFEFPELRDLEVQYLDDSKAFRTSIQSLSSTLTRICLNKMISIAFETLVAVKRSCQRLEVLELYVDSIYTTNRNLTLEQVVRQTPNLDWLSLKSLKLGGLMTTGSVLRFLLHGCPSIRVLCYCMYEEQADQVTDAYVEQLLRTNPMPALVAFYFEKCALTEQAFFHLVHHLPNLRYLGILSEWLGLDRKGRLAIEAYIRGNNLALDVSSVQDPGGAAYITL